MKKNEKRKKKFFFKSRLLQSSWNYVHGLNDGYLLIFEKQDNKYPS